MYFFVYRYQGEHNTNYSSDNKVPEGVPKDQMKDPHGSRFYQEGSMDQNCQCLAIS